MTKQRQAEVLKEQQENANRPRSHKTKGKASHPYQIKRSKTGSRIARTHDDNRSPDDIPSDGDTQDEDILIGDGDIISDDHGNLLGPDQIGFYTFFLEGQSNPPDLMGLDDDQLLAIQNDL